MSEEEEVEEDETETGDEESWQPSGSTGPEDTQTLARRRHSD